MGETRASPRKRNTSPTARRESTRAAAVMGPREYASSVEAMVMASTPREAASPACSEVVTADC
ncbi:MAG: hypothetical protein H5T71_03815, partial [Chloroflexi bacterium]|nr:hypothetical protein [Chloroflexota bacterium]